MGIVNAQSIKKRRSVDQPFDTSNFDVNSLIQSRLWSPEWLAQQYATIYSPTITLFNDPTDGYCALVNANANSPTYGTIYTRFICPPGVTEVTLRIKIKLPLGATPNSIRAGIFNPGFTDFVNSAVMSPTPTGTLTTHDLVYTGLVPGSIYFPIWNFNYPSQSPCLVKSVEVIPTSGSGLWSDTFYRLPCSEDTAILDGQPNVYLLFSTENTKTASSNTRYPINTNATLFAVEATELLNTFPEYAGVGIRVNGVPSQFLTSGITPGSYGYFLNEFTLSAGYKRVEPYVTPLSKGQVPGHGVWARALYVGNCTALQWAGDQYNSVSKFLIIGDSAACGFFGNVGYDAWSILTDSGRAKAVFKACAGQSLFDTCSDAAARTAYVATFADVDFDNLYVVVAANDAVSTTFGNVANYKAALEDFVDKFHAAYPTKGCYLQTALIWATNDNVVQPYRDAVTQVAQARSWVFWIDGLALLDASNLQDSYHPTPAGHVLLAETLWAALNSSGAPPP